MGLTGESAPPPDRLSRVGSGSSDGQRAAPVAFARRHLMFRI
jgi:hypothetical protein